MIILSRVGRISLFFTAIACVVAACRTSGSGINDIGGTNDLKNCDVIVDQMKKAEGALEPVRTEYFELGCQQHADLMSVESSRITNATAQRAPLTSRLTGAELSDEDKVPPKNLSELRQEADPSDPELAKLPNDKCRELKVFHDRELKYWVALYDTGQAASCDLTRLRGDTIVVEYPSCGSRHVCNDDFSRVNQVSCHTCEHPVSETSRITCQSEEAARMAVGYWCDNNDNCGDATPRNGIICRKASPADEQYARENRRVSGSSSWESGGIENQLFFEAYADGKVGIYKGRTAVRVAVDTSTTYQVVNHSDYQTWISRDGRVEAGPKTIFNCGMEVKAATVLSAEGGVEFGVKVGGQGAVGGFKAGASGGLKGSFMTLARYVTASGLTRENIIQRCANYALREGGRILKDVFESSFIADEIKNSDGNAPCLDNSDCKLANGSNAHPSGWVRLCDRPDNSVTAGECRRYGHTSAECNTTSSYPCRPGNRCELVSYWSFANLITFNKKYKCRQIYIRPDGTEIR